MAGYIQNSDGGYSVNYEDERFADVKNEQIQKEAQINDTYNNILDNSDKYYQNQIDAVNNYAKQQGELQQAQTDFAIQQVEQQKELAEKDYTKEQKASYVDYMKQTKSNAQNMSNSGLNNTGYSESSLVSMYNQYQSRVASAKDSLNLAMMNYNNSIQNAILANNEKLAEIAYNALQTQNQLNQQAFEYKNSVIIQREQELQKVNDAYYARYQNVLAQINNEIELQMELDRIDREYEQWIEQKNQWWTSFQAEVEQNEREYKLKEKQAYANLAQIDAQIAYTKAQTAALKSQSSNPYDENGKTVELNQYGQKLSNNLSAMNLNSNTNKTVARNLIYGEVKNGHIDDAQAEKLFNQFKL